MAKVYTRTVTEWIDGRAVMTHAEHLEYSGGVALCMGGGLSDAPPPRAPEPAANTAVVVKKDPANRDENISTIEQMRKRRLAAQTAAEADPLGTSVDTTLGGG